MYSNLLQKSQILQMKKKKMHFTILWGRQVCKKISVSFSCFQQFEIQILYKCAYLYLNYLYFDALPSPCKYTEFGYVKNKIFVLIHCSYACTSTAKYWVEIPVVESGKISKLS